MSHINHELHDKAWRVVQYHLSLPGRVADFFRSVFSRAVRQCAFSRYSAYEALGMRLSIDIRFVPDANYEDFQEFRAQTAQRYANWPPPKSQDSVPFNVRDGFLDKFRDK